MLCVGRYIPYIAQTLFSMSSPPVQLAKIAIGDPALGSNDEFKTMPVMQTLQAHPAIIGWDLNVYNWFSQQSVSSAQYAYSLSSRLPTDPSCAT
jgi:carboxypeptidase D